MSVDPENDPHWMKAKKGRAQEAFTRKSDLHAKPQPLRAQRDVAEDIKKHRATPELRPAGPMRGAGDMYAMQEMQRIKNQKRVAEKLEKDRQNRISLRKDDDERSR